jgi:hypothetical protein
MASKAVRGFSRRQAPGLLTALGDLFHNLTKDLFDAYRPELHYMRGPGPKWHAKHDRAPQHFDPMPALVRVRVKR